METLLLPILVSALFVFVVSSMLHMLIPYHRGDAKHLSAEDAFCDGLRQSNPKPGLYMFPACSSMKDMASETMIQKYKTGPVGFLTIIKPGAPAMGKSLLQWFLFTILASFCAAYVVQFSMGPGAEYPQVFRLSGTVAIFIYALGYIPQSIWMGIPWKNTVKFLVDGVIYGLTTAGTMGWLWPAA